MSRWFIICVPKGGTGCLCRVTGPQVVPHLKKWNANGSHFVALNRLWATKTRKKIFVPPLSSRYSERWVRNDSDDLCSQKFSVTECFTKIRVFLHFSVSACKKKVYHTPNSILMPPTFHIASLNNYTPKFSAYKQPTSWPVANSLAYSSSQRV